MATSKEELKEENKQVVQLVSDMANISVSDVKEKGVLALSALRNREEELIKNKMEVMERVEEQLRYVEEQAEIWKEIEDADQTNAEVDFINEEYKLLEKEYNESIEALESFGEFIVAYYGDEKAESELELPEITSGGVVTEDDSEEDLEGVQEKNEAITSNYEAEESDLISSNEVEDDKQIENAERKECLKMDRPRRSKRMVKDPFWMKDYITKIGKNKGKDKGEAEGNKE
ncbi:hypothetical protein AgCh_035959 [Apium graveolens]